MSETCPVNRCGRPLGIGTHMSLTGQGRAADQTVRVCEEHWQAVRPILPTPVERGESWGPGSAPGSGSTSGARDA